MDTRGPGPDWPNAEFSRIIDSKPHRWHVQVAGRGPTVLLLHGAGGASHSWRHVLPLLASSYHVVAPDLPGHAYTRLGARNRSGLKTMSEDLQRLCDKRGWRPDVIVGHSAGAAIAVQMAQMASVPPKALISVNGALGSFKGVSGWLFPALAQMLAVAPFAPDIFARFLRSESRVRALLESTGSRIDNQTVDLYRWLARDRNHVNGTLCMMAQWRVGTLLDRTDLQNLPVLFLVGEDDRTVPPSDSYEASKRFASAVVHSFAGTGHLLHEEAPELVVAEIRKFLDTLL